MHDTRVEHFFKSIWQISLKFAESSIGKKIDLSYSHNVFFRKILISSFFMFLIFGSLIYTDVYLFNSFTLTKILNHFFNPKNIDDIFPLGTARVLYGFSLFVAFCFSVLGAAFYYLKYGPQHDRSEQAGFYFHGFVIPCLVHFAFGWVAIGIILVGGYYTIILIPEKFRLNYIPIFGLIQIVLNAKIYSFITSFLVNEWLFLLPYSLHPKHNRA